MVKHIREDVDKIRANTKGTYNGSMNIKHEIFKSKIVENENVILKKLTRRILIYLRALDFMREMQKQ